MELRLRVHTAPRRDLFTDRDLGRHLVETVRASFPKTPAAAVAVRPDRIEIVPLHGLIEQKQNPGRFIAGLTTTGVDAVGLVGAFRYRPTPHERWAPIAMVFLEWTDCRWWQWRSLVAGDRLMPDTETFAAAIEGDAKPGGLGGWWSQARREGLQLTVHATPDAPVAPLVH
jgi:hypothetical protein